MHVEINCIRNLPIPNNYKEIERGKRVTVSPLYLSDALCESFILCFKTRLVTYLVEYIEMLPMFSKSDEIPKTLVQFNASSTPVHHKIN